MQCHWFEPDKLRIAAGKRELKPPARSAFQPSGHFGRAGYLLPNEIALIDLAARFLWLLATALSALPYGIMPDSQK
jgi:hypothetical protein